MSNNNADITQLVEYRTCNAVVVGSSPSVGFLTFYNRKVEMIKGELIVRNDVGLHARPSLRICEIARKYKHTKITIKNPANGAEADARSILSLLTLAVGGGQPIMLYSDGENEKAAFDEVSKVLETFSVN